MTTTILPETSQAPASETRWEPSGADRCDACGAQAYIRVVMASGELFFCAHHGRASAERLARVAVSVQDESARLLTDEGLTTAV